MPGKNFLFVDLADMAVDALTKGKAFDGLAAGSFVDMWFSRVRLEEDDFPEIVENTQGAIDATETESGEIVGLPIDAAGHDGGDGAGWIVEVEQNDDKIRLTPKWTEIGLELIQKGIRRFFSATVDLDNMVILGGSLTNWPAVKDKKGRRLLRPIELEDGGIIYELEKETELKPNVLQSAVIQLTSLWRQAFPSDAPELPSGETAGKSQESKSKSKPEVIEMEFTLEELQETITASVQVQLAEAVAQLAPTVPDSDDGGKTPTSPEGFDFLAFLEMQGVEDEVVEAAKKRMLGTFDAMQERAAREAADMISAIRRETNVKEFCHKAINGTEEVPRGIPAKNDELETFMLGLDASQLSYFQKVIDGILDGGIVEFEELGHGKDVVGTTELPDYYAEKLDNGELKLADLDSPMLSLGDISEYDLSKWKGQEQEA